MMSVNGVVKSDANGGDEQWFGIDIGGTLTKGVYFECAHTSNDPEQKAAIELIRKYVKSSLTYGSSGTRDEHLEITGQAIGQRIGTLHFLKFHTSRMEGFLNIISDRRLHDCRSVVCATGGGAVKFEKDINEKLDIKLRKYDELLSLVTGLHYICQQPNECFTWTNLQPSGKGGDQKTIEFGPNLYPYIIVNIGSGVSIMSVQSEDDVKRIGGSSIGGGTFTGLCALLTGCTSFAEAISLAEKGDNTKVDKLVKDIYGGSYDKFGLSADTIATSFGFMMEKEKREQASRADLAKATLVTITNNIGAITMMCANSSGINKVVFAGNYLTNNKMSMQMLTYALDYWSKGTIQSIFLRHEGYCGALGALIKHCSLQ